MAGSIERRLQERVKELTALHSTARLLQDAGRDLDEVMPRVAALLPPAWQHPDCAGGRIRWRDRQWSTPGFVASAWLQSEAFRLRDGTGGDVTVSYGRECPPADEGPFLSEERDLIRSLADLLRAYFQHRCDDAAIVSANERLERQVAERTAGLRRLAREVCLAEERERRQIAEDLHDHLGQALAVMKIRLQQLRGDAMLGGHDRALAELLSLSEQAIRYTRGLTFELSPPVLYELGLGPTLEWFGERIEAKHGLQVEVKAEGRVDLPDDLKIMLWKCCRELVHNVVKHAAARKLTITLEGDASGVVLEVADDGCGFDPAVPRDPGADRFGLDSIEERLRDFGGRMQIASAPGRGARVRLTTLATGGRP